MSLRASVPLFVLPPSTMAIHFKLHLPILLFYFFLLLDSTLFIQDVGSAPVSLMPKLVQSEVNALKEIAKQLGKTDWNFSVDPCMGVGGNWTVADPYGRKGFESSVTCDCAFGSNNDTCHVITIALKAQNLSGVLPPDFSELPYLRTLDLSRNLLTGSVPKEWFSMKLVELSLMGNRLSGRFPSALAQIRTLESMSLEGNLFSGPIPLELGYMVNLRKLVLSSNRFTGELPYVLAELTNLTDMRINDNNFSGPIPEYIRNWTSIEKLHIQGTNLEGPIPVSISELTRLIDLRISDLSGKASDFPPLSRLESIKVLILRKCLLQGSIPEYIGNMKKLKLLDLSFNNLTGEIPESFSKLGKVDFMYLTRNILSGTIPKSILRRNKNVDLSYNNFTWDSSNEHECPQGSVNLVESFSAVTNLRKVHPCLVNRFPCGDSIPSHSSLHINCGGKEISDGDAKYEADVEPRGASMFYSTKSWAFSSTGNYMDDSIESDNYIVGNNSVISDVSRSNSELYTTARASPLSLTYYGLCLISGNYTIKLHFAEPIYRNDSSFASLGRRIFDVYVQGKMVLKDFNIEDEAGGPSKPIVKTFITVVEKNTLAIQFYWAGKGTQGIPDRGAYGPLISAVSVEPNFKPPAFTHKSIPIAFMAGLASASFLVLLVIAILWRKGWLCGRVSTDKDFKNLDAQTGSFSLRQIKAATKNFGLENKIGEGGFGPVYKGLLPDGTVVAIKQLSSKSKQGSREFVNEIGMISALEHPNLVKLYGFCVEGNQLSLIYEYMENNCLSRALFSNDPQKRLKLDWPIRRKICLGIARGLAYMHEESTLKIVHRDIKTSNVLLDKDFNAKIADFGLARLNEGDKTHISTQVAGTVGYMAPEYAMHGYLSDKADVYSFGVVALEILSGKNNNNYKPEGECYNLLEWAYALQEEGRLLELVDPSLELEYPKEEATMMLDVAVLCTTANPTLRPTMSQVVSIFEGRTSFKDLPSDLYSSSQDPRIKNTRKHFWQKSQTHSMSTTGPVTNLSISNADKVETGHLLKFRAFASA